MSTDGQLCISQELVRQQKVCTKEFSSMFELNLNSYFENKVVYLDNVNGSFNKCSISCRSLIQLLSVSVSVAWRQ